MSAQRQHPLPERATYLALLAASPTIWAAHFLLSYCTAAVWCAKVGSGGETLGGAGIAIWVFTAVALVAITAIGWQAWGRHRYGDAELPHDFGSPEDRHRFLGFACMLLSGLSAVAVVFSGIAIALVGSCR